MAKNRSKKISLIYEGDTEYELIIFLKNKLFDVTAFSVCKKHSTCIKGTIKQDNIKEEKNCCQSIYVFDKDDLDEEKINKLKKSIEEKNHLWIISNPCIEIYLLCFFQDITSLINIERNNIIQKISQHTQKEFSFKYEKNMSSLKHLFKSIEKDLDKYRVSFSMNLLSYSKNNPNTLKKLLDFFKVNIK